MTTRPLTIALAGNPNSGKTTTFNNITGTHQKVGNWPGVTVEKKEGRVTWNGYTLKVVDLPGTYSLTAFSMEEIIARDFILDTKPDVVVDIIDASNLERSLYLATQLRELDTRVLFVLNMADVMRARGLHIDTQKLSELLDVSVVFTVGNKNQGTESLLRTIVELAESGKVAPAERRVKYNSDFERAIETLGSCIAKHAGNRLPYNLRWVSIKLLEGDPVVQEKVRRRLGEDADEVLQEALRIRGRLADFYDEEPEIVMTDERYGFIAGIIKEVLKSSTEKRVDFSRNIDLVLTNRFLGFPIFVFFIWAMFQLTFSLGAYPMAWLEAGVEAVSRLASALLPAGMVRELLVDGVLGGVGSVLVFLPNILILFLCIALFEDTGYLARAAFLMDKIMHLVGLHGKSFIPLLMGFGCNVPAVMATRTLESEKDRILTILINPFMSCSARLPVYVLLAGTFFARNAGDVIFSIYLLGIVLAVLTGRLFRSTVLRGETAPFVMELPPYRAPMVRGLLIHMWERSKLFLKKMGGIILVGSVVIWGLSAFPRQSDTVMRLDEKLRVHRTDLEKMIAHGAQADRIAIMRDTVRSLERAQASERVRGSYLGRIGRWISPVFEPLGMDWKASVALLAGFVAKEIVVSTLGVLYATEDESADAKEALSKALRDSGMTRLSAYSMMAFVLLYVPCLATVAAIRREANSWRWAAFSVAYSTALAWIVAFVIFQVGSRISGLV